MIALSTTALAACAVFGACTDEGEGAETTSAVTSTNATSATSGPSTTSTSATTSASSSTSSGTGGGGGGSQGCIDPTTAASVFSIETAELCVVASYTAPALTLDPYGVVPTWGRHNGPLTSSVVTGTSSDDIHIERWSISGATLTMADTTISGVTEIPSTAFPGAQAIDVPFGGLTAVSWNGSSFTTEGGVVFLDATHVTGHNVATGVFGLAALGTAASARILYTGLSAFDGPTNATTALYSADFANGTLGTSQAVEAWGEANGPVAVDGDGNVIAINTKFSDGTQEIHGFAASAIAPGQAPTAGQILLTTDGFGTALAAMAPSATLPGLMLYQPQTGNLGTYGDVIVLRYTVSAGSVAALSNETILKLTTANTNLTLMADDQGRVWVGAPAATGSVFYVLARP